MRIAFVGKGGSGKSTLSALFFLHLLKQNHTAACIDADLNIHIPQLLGLPADACPALSEPTNAKQIKTHLLGSSSHIASIDHMYKTTPPSRGVNLVTIDPHDPIMRDFAATYQDPAATSQSGTGLVLAVGTYHKHEIGVSCYHTNLSILENLLSFTKPSTTNWIVADMVAGIDAFSNTLHQQFDALILVVEPTAESMSVYEQYTTLADHAGMLDRLRVIANKVEDDTDHAFVAKHIAQAHYLGAFARSTELKHLRQQQQPLSMALLDQLDTSVFSKAQTVTQHLQIDPVKRLAALRELHKRYVAQDYVRNAVGDITTQIDLEFSF